MRIGISPFASSADGAVAIAETAVRGGLDTLWLGDGYLHNPDFPDWAGGMESLTELGWLSGRVTDARIGITAAVLTLRDPVWTAKQANTLHRLAGGGFVLVLTPGFRRADLEARGLAHQHRGGVFAEAVDELVDALDDPS
ncbi:MAG: LLM class flavin-dependent oxidoreductase, partial [Acidimicrobiales bacterium]